MRDKRDRQKKRFIAALTEHGTVRHAAQAAGVSRNTVYRWRHEDFEFAEAWAEAHENAVDVVENVIYQQAAGGNTLAAFFYLKGSPSEVSRSIEHQRRTSAERHR